MTDYSGDSAEQLEALAAGMRADLAYRRGESEMNLNWRTMVEVRIANEPELQPYRWTILYDWTEGDEHWQWAATAPVAEIVDWAETVEQAADKAMEE